MRMMIPRLVTSSFLLLLLFVCTTSTTTNAITADDWKYETSVGSQEILRHHHEQPNDCHLYLAPSSIPNAGWGMYTNIPLKKDSIIQPVDLTIQVHDTGRHRKTYNKVFSRNQHKLPTWVMRQYYWDTSVTNAGYESKSGSSIIPSYGMLANSHPGLVNLDNQGVLRQTLQSRGSSGSSSNPSVGAYTQWKNQSFVMTQDLPAGHELFADYGDAWFRQRTDMFGKIPLRNDYKKADRLLKKVYTLCNENDDESSSPKNKNKKELYCNDMYTMVYDFLSTYDPEVEDDDDDENDDDEEEESEISRMGNALPKTLEDVFRIYESDYGGAAFHLQPNVIRSKEWFQQEGLCLDHMEPRELKDSQEEEMGAFAKRYLPKHTIVAPAPLIHMSKHHLQILLMDKDYKKSGDYNTIYYKGHQLLMNYCYGHVSSSMLLFPYSPVTNFINHAPSPSAAAAAPGNKTANIGLRWSSYMSSPDWLSLTTEELLTTHDDHAGLMMEFVALTDIQEGDELLLDYGSAWQEAWEKHVQELNDSSSNDDDDDEEDDDEVYQEAQELKTREPLLTHDQMPSNIMSLCWLDLSDKGVQLIDKKKRHYRFKKALRNRDQANAKECTIQSAHLQKKATTYEYDSYEYTIQVKGHNKNNNKKGQKTILGVPRDVIDLVDRPYSRHQYLRRAFRHEIQLPEEMVPLGWRDLEEPPKPYYGDDDDDDSPTDDDDNNKKAAQCGLYLAQSLIPNSGLGMFTAKTILGGGTRVYNGDVVIQVEDYKVNKRLRHWHHNTSQTKEPEWHLHDYYWQSSATMGEFDAGNVQSIVPGLGMLANSHPGLVNVVMRPPNRQDGNLHRSLHPEAGASTQYHDVHYVTYADDTIEAGSELFVEYGDAWFSARTDSFGLLPLSDDFDTAQEMLTDYYENTLKKKWEDHSEPKWNDFVQDNWDKRNVRIRKEREEEAAKEKEEEEEDDTDEDDDDDDDDDEEKTAKEDEDFETWLQETQTRLENALPPSYQEVQSYLEHGTATSSVPQQAKHSLEYLAEHGICLDHIQPFDSTLPRAHKGAVTVRSLSEGDVVSAAPVVPIRRHHLEIWDAKHYHLKSKAGTPWYLNPQLLMNYCYGHTNSSLLLFPYSPVVNYINHHPEEHNVELRWSSRFNKEDLLEMTPDELMVYNKSGLVLEIVVTRDLQPGDEIFLDYGSDYEHAWQRFRNELWKGNEVSEPYVSSIQLNNQGWLTPIRTVYEEPAYPPTVMTVCTVPNLDGDLSQHPKVTVVEENKRYQAKWFYQSNMYHTLDKAHICQVLSRYGGQFLDSVQPELEVYTIAIEFKEEDSDHEEETMVFTNVPRRAIQFYDREYTTDATALRGPTATFRHEIGVPTEIFPKAWMDL